MSNILIIKHGSLGDIAQASGAIQDISENHKNDQIFLLTTKPYLNLLRKNPFIHDVILDKRLPKYNLIYLFNLMKELKKYNFLKIFDLQNSSRTSFYKKILFPKAKNNVWCSDKNTMQNKTNKIVEPVLKRFEHQLQAGGVKTSHTMKPDFSWACDDISEIKKKHSLKNYILLFPFCSPHLTIKKWPFYHDLIKLILNKYGEKYKIVIAPGPNEIRQAQDYNATIILKDEDILNICELTSLIKESTFIVANDTGPAHIAAHVGAKGLTLFGSHTSAFKVSIERENFKPIQVGDLKNLSVERVFERLKSFLD